MSRFQVSQMSDDVLLHQLQVLVARDRANLIELLVHIGETEARGLYQPAGYPSMIDYCIGVLGMAEGSAYRRVRVAKACRRHAALLQALERGDIHLTAAAMIEPRLTSQNATELIELARGRSKDALEPELANRFPRRDVVALLESLDFAKSQGPLSPETTVPSTCTEVVPEPPREPAAPSSATVHAPSPEALRVAAKYPRIAALGPGRHALQATITQQTRDKIERARDLLAHVVPSGALDELLEHAFDVLLEKLEKRVHARTDAPRTQREASDDPSYIPAHIRRTVWQRDGGRCTFTSADGHRCECTRGLEFDHVVPRADGGESTVSNLRLLCRTHNQYEAERRFGRAFMNAKRAAARAERAPAPHEADVRQALKLLRCHPEQVAAGVAAMRALPPGATLERCMRAALAVVQPRGTWKCAPAGAARGS